VCGYSTAALRGECYRLSNMGRKRSFIWMPLMGLSALYGALTRVRNALYDRGSLRAYTSSLPVMSVGNLTAGGNGKTPLCLYLVEALRSRGLSPVILSRGYGGRCKGPYLVKTSDAASEVGDEPLLMARSVGCPVVIARSRATGARMIEREKLGNVIVLDDGFQHRALARDLDIVSMFAGSEEAVDAFERGEILPLGLFREDRDIGLQRTDIFVVSYRNVVPSGEEMPAVDPRILALIPSGVTVFRAAYDFLEVRSLASGSAIPPQRVHGCAGIANPQGFFESLERVGYQVEQRHAFPDHYAFTEAELARLVDTHPGTLFVCTEKDAVKIRGMSERVVASFAEFRVRLKVVPSDAFIVAVMRSIQNVSPV
jgi:tetraacyldisaccharide 4'-kinase